MPEKASGKKQYLINMEQWRSDIALAACVLALLSCIVALDASLVRYAAGPKSVSVLFRYFTTLGNMLTAVATSFTIPYRILRALADKYSMNIENLVKVFSKGLMDGAAQKDGSQKSGR